MNNFPIEHNGKTYWISRSVATSGYIFCLIMGRLYVLAAKRGKGCPNYQGYWNCPCGYLDYNETTKEGCCREIKEETNLTVNPNDLHLFDINDDPKDSETQNITFNYWAYSSHFYSGQTIHAANAEKDEVDEVEWVSISNINNYKWAFNHKEKIALIAYRYLYNELSNYELSEIKKLIFK